MAVMLAVPRATMTHPTMTSFATATLPRSYPSANGAASTHSPVSATVKLATRLTRGLNARAAQSAVSETNDPVTMFSVTPTPVR